MNDKQRQARADLESYLQEKAQSMLDQVLGTGPGRGPRRLGNRLQPGAGNHGEVRPEEFRHHDGEPAPSSTTSSTKSQGTRPRRGNDGKTASPSDTNGKANEEKKENTSNQYQVGKTTESRVTGAGSIKRLTIALMLNEAKPATPAPSRPRARPQEIKSLENIVKAAVGFTKTTPAKDLIQSQEVPFADMFDDSPPARRRSRRCRSKSTTTCPTSRRAA